MQAYTYWLAPCLQTEWMALSVRLSVAVFVVSVCVAAINIAVECDDENNLLNCLQNNSVRLHGVTPHCIGDYLRHLKAFKEEKEQSGDAKDFHSAIHNDYY